MSTDIDVLNFYTKGKSIIRGSFPVSVNDQNACNVSTKTITEQNVFIDEGISGNDGGNGGITDCTGCGTTIVQTSNGYCAFTKNNNPINDTSILGYSDQIIINLNGTGPYATPSPSLASYRPTNYCKFKTKTINQIGPGSNITVTSTFISDNNIQTTANGTISYIVDIYGTLTVFTAILKKVDSTYYWDFSISCGTPPQTNTVLNHHANGSSAWTPDFTGLIPEGAGGYGNLLPYSACGSTVPTNGITAGGTATITLSDPVFL